MRKYFSSHLKPKPTIHVREKQPKIKEKKAKYVKVANTWIPVSILEEQEKARQLELLKANELVNNPEPQMTWEEREHERKVDLMVAWVLNNPIPQAPEE